MRPKLVAANWKMNGSAESSQRWLEEFEALGGAAVQAVVCPPFPYLAPLAWRLRQAQPAVKGPRIELGAQDLSANEPGARTGDVAGEMLADVGVAWVIVGHSERRASRGETDEVVVAKLRRALACGLRPILCVGESLAERQAGRTLAVVGAQIQAALNAIPATALATGAVAYEPIWAIGTGLSATPAQAQEVHAAIRGMVAGTDPAAAAALRLLYGGSVNAANAAELFSQPDIDGGLVGGASLKATDFARVCAGAVPAA